MFDDRGLKWKKKVRNFITRLRFLEVVLWVALLCCGLLDGEDIDERSFPTQNGADLLC